MKKLLLTTLTILGCGAAYALPVGNPWEASLHRDGIICDGHCEDFCDPCSNWCDAWSFRIGFYGDYVFNRNLEVDGASDADIHKAELFTNAGYLAFNMWNRVDVFATLGATNFWIESPRRAFGGPNNVPLFIKTETDFSWSVGGRATLWECGCFGLGLEGQYFSACPGLDYARVDGRDPVYIDGVDFDYSEWQVGIGAAYRINISSCNTALVPYVAVAWSGVKTDSEDFHVLTGTAPDLEAILFDLQNKKWWTWAVGATLLGCEKASVTVEGRFAAEKALYVNSQFRF